MTIVTDLSIVSYGGHNINDGTNYEAGLTPGIEWGLPDVGANLVERSGAWPLVSGIARSGREITFIVRIKGAATRTLRDQLLRWFDPESETPANLIIEDADTTNDRYVAAICTSCLPLTGDRAAVAEAFLVTLVTHGDPRWRATNGSSHEWTITGTGDTDTVSNGGTDDAYPKITITPTASKTSAAGGSYIYRRFISIRWRVSEGYNGYPIDVLDDGFDTASLVETATSTTLNGALAQAASTVSVADASSFPTSGMAYIVDGVNGDEQISYTGKSGNDLTGVTRGIGGTSDVNHGDGETIELSKMLANGADLRIEVDGEEVDRWLDGMDTATTKAWISMDFQAKQELTIDGAIASGDTVTTLTMNESVADLPDAGIVIVNSEAFVWTGKTEASKQLTGVTRAAHGTSAGNHSDADTAWWCQHSVYVKYGDEGASAPSVDSDYEPAFELDHSTNTSWVYEEFGEDDGLRPGQWSFVTLKNTPGQYGGNQGASADPWVELGIETDTYGDTAEMVASNPCGITNANYSNGQKYSEDLSQWRARIYAGTSGTRIWEDTIAAPAAASNWEAWSDNEALTTGSTWVSMYLKAYQQSDVHKLECADCTLTLNSSNTPAIVIGSERGGATTGYELACTIANTTTGDSISVAYLMDVDDELEIDTDLKTVTDKQDESSQFQALTLVGGPRKDWLKLQPGNNNVEYTEVGAAGLTVTFEWEARRY